MREGAAWDRLRQLLDLVQDAALVSCAFDAHAAQSDNFRKLRTRGAEVLRKQVATEAYVIGDTFVDPHDVATSATSDDFLARLFVGLGLDSRLHRHPQALGSRGKADVLRILVAELDRGQGLPSRFGASSPAEDLLRGLAGALLQLHAEKRPRSASGDRSQGASDVKLLSLLQRGSARAIVARLRAMAKAPRPRLDIRNTIAKALPMLCDNPMRFGVFMHVLQVLCRPQGNALDEHSDAESASLLTAVVEGILTSGIQCLLCENADQVEAVRHSPLLTSMQRQHLLELMMATGACDREDSPCRSCGNTGIDMSGQCCDCLYGQAVNFAQREALSNSPRIGAHSNMSDFAATLGEPHPVDLPPRPVSPCVRPISPGRTERSATSEEEVDMLQRFGTPRGFAGSYVNRRPPSIYIDTVSPRSTVGSYVDRRPLKPYMGEHLRPWIPQEEPMQYESGLSPRWCDATQRIQVRTPQSQRERDDRVVQNLCGKPFDAMVGNDLLSGEDMLGYPLTALDRDDRALQALCNNFNTISADYPARLAFAATRFRELADNYELVPHAIKQNRTSALLRQTDLKDPSRIATMQHRTSNLLNQTDVKAAYTATFGHSRQTSPSRTSRSSTLLGQLSRSGTPQFQGGIDFSFQDTGVKVPPILWSSRTLKSNSSV